MARPARKLAAEPHIEGEADNDAQALDEASQQEQSTRTGLVSEGELDLARSVAKRMGWTPKEDWKRDPAKWRDAPEFLEDTPRELDALKERNRRTAQAAEAAIEDAARQARIDAQAKVRAAAEAQDPDAAVQAAEDLAKANAPRPEAVAWVARNDWIKTDPAARAVAEAVVQERARMGATTSDQLEAAEAEVRRRFPEHFGQAERKEPEPEVKLSERRVHVPPAVNPGTRGGNQTPKEKGFADIPPGDRALYAKHFARNYESMGLKSDEAQAKYARSYWTNKGEA